MRTLILVRHSIPEFVPELPASQWHLSAQGRALCGALAKRLALHEPSLVISSQESKTVETGQIVAGALGIPFETAPNLHEHQRQSVKFMASRAEFRALVCDLLEHPERQVFGEETGEQARRRFANAIRGVIERHAVGNLVVVTHGTVMALFVAQKNAIPAVPFWRRLGLPSFVVVSLPDFALLEIVDTVTSQAPESTH